MEVDQVDDVTKCRILTSSLRGNALQWFQSTCLDSISSWDQMMKMFLTQFQFSMQYAPLVTVLSNIRQREVETLRSYFMKFDSKVLLVKGTTDETVNNFLITGVRVGRNFWKMLQQKVPVTLSEMYALVEPFKMEEEVMVGTRNYDHASAPRGEGTRRMLTWLKRNILRAHDCTTHQGDITL